MRVIAFTGMPFSGKSEAVNIAKKHNIPVVRMGDLVWEEVKKRGLELSNTTVGKIANDMRSKHGTDIWAQKTIEKIRQMNISDQVIIDGIRNPEEIETFKQAFGQDFLLVAITASDTIRYHRAQLRNRIDDSTNIDEIKKRDERETKWGVREVMGKADKTFQNENSLESFRHQITHFFHMI